jgi:hypothetical protein
MDVSHMDQAGWCTSNILRLVFHRYTVQLLARLPAFLMKVYCDFPQSHEVNARIVPSEIYQDCFFPNPYLIIFHDHIYISINTI